MFVFLVFWGVTTQTCLAVRGRKIRSLGYPGDLRVLDNGLTLCKRKVQSCGLADKDAYLSSIPGTHTVERKNQILKVLLCPSMCYSTKIRVSVIEMLDPHSI